MWGRREAGVCRSCSQRRSDVSPRHDPVAFRNRCPDQQRLDQAPRIAAFGHVKVAPNPAAADRTSSSPPDCKRSMGRATPSSKGHSSLRKAQASSGSPTTSTTSANPPVTRPGPTIWPAGMFSRRFVDRQAISVFLAAQSYTVVRDTPSRDAASVTPIRSSPARSTTNRRSCGGTSSVDLDCSTPDCAAAVSRATATATRASSGCSRTNSLAPLDSFGGLFTRKPIIVPDDSAISSKSPVFSTTEQLPIMFSL